MIKLLRLVVASIICNGVICLQVLRKWRRQHCLYSDTVLCKSVGHLWGDASKSRVVRMQVEGPIRVGVDVTMHKSQVRHFAVNGKPPLTITRQPPAKHPSFGYALAVRYLCSLQSVVCVLQVNDWILHRYSQPAVHAGEFKCSRHTVVRAKGKLQQALVWAFDLRRERLQSAWLWRNFSDFERWKGQGQYQLIVSHSLDESSGLFLPSRQRQCCQIMGGGRAHHPHQRQGDACHKQCSARSTPLRLHR
mmetsp:Transcript_52160/g.124293  ORF Transcript_52160/g.124293 Transcript_52160/m.124293 type:complete len:248 (-) Transcript_52160:121-864(-)